MALPGFYQVFFGAMAASPARIALAIGLSLALGAVHAVSPGHGKTLVVASLLGSRGSLGRALLLALSVAITHTAGVLALAAVVLVANDALLPGELTPWLTLVASMLVVAFGADLTRRAVQAGGRPEGRTEPHDHTQPHGHPHVHPHPRADAGDADPGTAPGHEHAQQAPSGLNLGRGYTILIGIVGGFVPNATALVVLTMAISLGQLALGLLLVACFGIGMALVLVAVGIGAVVVRRRGGDISVRSPRWSRAVAWLPTASGVAVMAVGLFLTFEALGNLHPG
jgi:nickel/cobalt exporter